MSIFNKNLETSKIMDDLEKNIKKTKTILFKIIKDENNVTVKIAYDYIDNYINCYSETILEKEKNYEMCQIDFDLSYFRDLTFNEIQYLTMHSNVTDIVNKYSIDEDRTPTEYFIIFHN